MKFLFLCKANTISKMAEGFAREILGPEHKVLSAGSGEDCNVHPLAEKVMLEAGVNILNHKPCSIANLPPGFTEAVDYVIALCGQDFASKNFPRAKILCWPFANPDILNPDGDSLITFQRLRDLLRVKIKSLKKELDLG
ncbi:hypothetical protein ACFL35_01715 [Candidatus Riflebacteria bacterium]